MQPLDAGSVRDWRHRRMLSQQEVADRAGTSLFTIQRIERGEGGVRPKTGRAVAQALGVPVEEILPKAQAPLWSHEPTAKSQGAFSYRDAREALEEYCEKWERLISEGALDEHAIDEFARAGAGWIPMMDVALRAELDELAATIGPVQDRAELYGRSELYKASRRYHRVAGEIFEQALRDVDGDSVIVLEEVRERLADMRSREAV